MSCAVGVDRAWFGWLEQRREKLLARCVVISARGKVLATYRAEAAESTWTQSMRGACAVGPYLFVPTDDGIVRVEIDGAEFCVTRTFPTLARASGMATATLSGITVDLDLVAAGDFTRSLTCPEPRLVGSPRVVRCSPSRFVAVCV